MLDVVIASAAVGIALAVVLALAVVGLAIFNLRDDEDIS